MAFDDSTISMESLGVVITFASTFNNASAYERDFLDPFLAELHKAEMMGVSFGGTFPLRETMGIVLNDDGKPTFTGWQMRQLTAILTDLARGPVVQSFHVEARKHAA